MNRMTQTEKTEWITELAKCRYKVLMRDHIPQPYKSAADEACEATLAWRNAWRAARDARIQSAILRNPHFGII